MVGRGAQLELLTCTEHGAVRRRLQRLWDAGLFPGISKILVVSHIIRYDLLSQESAEGMQYRVGPILFSYLFFLLIREKISCLFGLQLVPPNKIHFKVRCM